MNKKLTLLAALALGGCAMATGSTLAELQASTWQLQHLMMPFTRSLLVK